MIEAIAPAKIILFGEHSVVYDKTGIAGAVSLYSKAEVKPSKEVTLILKDYGIKEKTNFEEIQKMKEKADELIREKDYKKLKELTGEALTNLKIVIAKAIEGKEKKPFELTVSSEVPRGGFGSSSSIFSATTTAIQKFLGNKIDKKEIAETANYGDIGAHGGTPSGIDSSTITYGGYIEYKKSKGVTPLEISTELPIVIGNTGIPAKTSETVTRVRELKEEKPEKINKILNEMNEIAEKGIEEIKNNNLKKVGELMNMNQEKLRQLEVSCPELENLIEASLTSGAIGAKLTGGGGGGIMIALAPGKEQQVAEAIERAGGQAIITKIGVEGVKVI